MTYEEYFMKNFLKVMFGRVMFTVLCVLLQLAWMIVLVWKLNQYFVWFSLFQEIIALIVILRINAKSEFSAARLVWTIVILALPLFGIMLYLMFGRRSLTRKQRKRYALVSERFTSKLSQDPDIMQTLEEKDVYVHNQSLYIQKSSRYPIYTNTQTTFFAQTEPALESMLADLKKAKHFIFMEYFAIEDAQAFGRIKEVLLEKQKEGVEVRLIYDDFGSIGFVRPQFMRQLNQQGIQCRIFNPLVPFLYIFMNNRDHRKITVIDNQVSYTGGFNLADEYFNITHPYGHWKDTGLRLEGDAVASHTTMFLEMWNFIQETDVTWDKYLIRCIRSEEVLGDRHVGTDHSAISSVCASSAEATDCSHIETTSRRPGSLKAADSRSGYVQPYSDTPLDNVTLGENVYMNILKSATRYVYISTPYLIIDNEMEKELKLAAQRGVDVRIITPAIPDKKLVFLVTQSYYPSLIEAGVRIYQYTPGFIHAKGYVCDDKIGVVGTINMDYRSLYLHFECATYLYDCPAITDMKADFLDTFEKSEEIGPDYCNSRSIFIRGLQCVLRLFSPLL